MRLLFCLNGPNELNGPNVWLMRHLPLLRAHSFSIEILYLSYRPDSFCSYREFFERQGFPVHSLKMKGFVEDQADAIVAALADDLPDVFIPNYSIPAYYAARFLREAGVLTIGTLHSDDPFYHDIVDYFVTGTAAWRLSAVVGVSDYLTEMVREKAESVMPCLHAPYGVPIPTGTPEEPQTVFRLVYSGRLVEWQKRIRRVASSMVAAARADERVEGVIYGVGPEKAWLQAELAGADFGARVYLGGLLPADEIQNVLKTAHAFVLLSDFEGLSIALMEAMAGGVVPIVSRMRSGADDLIEDGVNGFLIEGADVGAFVKVVQQLADDSTLWRRMSTAARQTILKRDMTSAACARKWKRFLEYLKVDSRPCRLISVPPLSGWNLPPRSKRACGIRNAEHRNPIPLFTKAVRAGRPVYLWGASQAGRQFVGAVGGMASKIAGFVDSDTSIQGGRLSGISIFSPAYLAQLCKKSPCPYVLITSQFADEIASSLYGYGLRENSDFALA